MSDVSEAHQAATPECRQLSAESETLARARDWPETVPERGLGCDDFTGGNEIITRTHA